MCPSEEPLDPEELAARYLLSLEDGRELDLGELALELADDGSREEFLQLVQDAGALQGLLPVQVRPGVVLAGRYKVLREVDTGGMGKVFEALDTVHHRSVALKILVASGGGVPEQMEQLDRDTQILSRFRHANIVSMHEVGQDGETTFMVMDLVRGQDLEQVLIQIKETLQEQKPRDAGLLAQPSDGEEPSAHGVAAQERTYFRAVVRLVLSLARTIESAHGHGLVHRDIKPQNILLRGDGTPVLLDFGLAALAGSDQSKVSRGQFGTPAYLAPEQAVTGTVGSDPRTDVYQLGIVLYELLTLRRAFEGKSVTDLTRRISMGEMAAPRTHDKKIPSALEAICLKAAATHPNARYQAAVAFADDLACFLDGSAVPMAVRTGRLGPWACKTRQLVQRRPAVVAVLAAVLLAGAAWILWSSQSASAPGNTARFFRWTPDRLGGDLLAELALGQGTMVFRDQSHRAHPGDVLGFELAMSGRSYVYALSVFGRDARPEWLAPVRLSELTAQGESGSDRVGVAAGRWGLRVPGGSIRLACTQLGAWSAGSAQEGLWVFTSATEQPRLDAWLARMWEEEPQGAISLAQSQQLFEASGLSSGDGAALLAVSFSMGDMLRDDVWPVEDPQFHEVSFAVHKP